MSNVKQIAFDRGIALLRASGATFAAIFEDTPYTSSDTTFLLSRGGVTAGDYVAPAPVPGKRRKMTQPRRSWVHTGYLEAVQLLEPGQHWVYQCANKEESVALQKAVSGRAGQVFGSANFITTVGHDLKFELLRVA